MTSEVPARMAWSAADTPGALRAAIERDGIGVVEGLAARDAARAPWEFAEALFGQRPRMVERQPIRPVPGARSFAAGTMPAPFHTDSQLYMGAPPHAQVMVCARPDARGQGAGLYLDTWALLDRVARGDPALYDALFDVPRQMPFVFGDVFGPTVARRAGGGVAFTQPASWMASDPVGPRLAPWIAQAETVEVLAREGDAVVIDNHRMLHGRRGFDDPRREFVRLLVWLRDPFAPHPAHRARAERAAHALARALAGQPAAVRARLGVEAAEAGEGDGAARRRLEVVLEMLRGAPPGKLAAREGVPEPELYRWRDAALTAAQGALADGALDPAGHARAFAAAWEALRRR